MKRGPLKLKFKIDPVKAAAHGYDYDKILADIDAICKSRYCVKLSSEVYAGHGDESDLYCVGMSIRDLVHRDWFRACAKTLYLVAPDGYEDAIQYYKQEGFSFG